MWHEGSAVGVRAGSVLCMRGVLLACFLLGGVLVACEGGVFCGMEECCWRVLWHEGSAVGMFCGMRGVLLACFVA